MFFAEYPILGSLKIVITLKFLVYHITLRTTKLSPLRFRQQARVAMSFERTFGTTMKEPRSRNRVVS